MKWVVAVMFAVCLTACGDDDTGGGTGGNSGFGGVGATGGFGGSGGVGATGGFGGSGGVGATGAIGATGGTGGVAATGGLGGVGATGGVGGAGAVGATGGTGGVGDAAVDSGSSAVDAGADSGALVADAAVDSGSGTTFPNPDNRVTAANFCARLATLQCAAEASCCTTPSRRYASNNACVTSQRDFCETQFQIAAIGADPDAAYSVEHAGVALDEFQQRTEACDPTVAAWGVSIAGFSQIFRGTKAANVSCQPSSSTDYGAAVSCRIEDGLTCVPGSEFGGVPTLWSCKPFSALNGRCYTEVNCQDGLRCNEPETFSTCVARKATGTSCTYNNECASLQCEGGQCVTANTQDAYCLGG